MAKKTGYSQEQKELTYEEKISSMGETAIAVMDLYLMNPGKWNQKAAINALLGKYEELELGSTSTDLEDAINARKGAGPWEN